MQEIATERGVEAGRAIKVKHNNEKLDSRDESKRESERYN
jgi:hypothetical protein